MADKKDRSERTKPGPDPERLKLDEDDWKEAVRKVLRGVDPSGDESSEGSAVKGGDAEG